MPSRESASREISGRRYPSRSDYELLLPQGVEMGSASDAALAQIVRHWHGSGANGCAFAQWISKRVSEVEWPCVVVRELGSVGAAHMGETLDFLARESPAEIVSVLFPDVVEARDVLARCDGLLAVPRFHLENSPDRPGHIGRRLRYALPSGESAWVMAFGPFEWMPATRQGPVLEFTIRMKPKPAWLYWKLNQDRGVAHLADYPAPLRGSAWDRLFDLTLEETRRILAGPPDDISAAKQTLVIPKYELAEYETIDG